MASPAKSGRAFWGVLLLGAALGALAAVSAEVSGVYLAATRGWLPANADAPPPALERWFATTALNALILREASTAPNPVAYSDANFVAGVRIYAANCAVCHGAASGRASNIARGLYQKAPQLARYGVADDNPGDVYWKIAHGIRMTGMPAFGGALSQKQIWQLVLFLQNMHYLPRTAQKIWDAVPGAAATQADAPSDLPSRSPQEKRS
ncbi:MAG TPA: c-type cytochrome [Elusimicrobiota bacterium]|nr:c-type cytochrome [Elusimicrobiota bacterium]